jgi:hypothetical protein
MVAGKVAWIVDDAGLMGAPRLGSELGVAVPSGAAVLLLLGVDPLCGISQLMASLGPGRRVRCVDRQRRLGSRVRLAAGLALLGHAAALGAVAPALTVRRDVS